jgi:hypothetical protein
VQEAKGGQPVATPQFDPAPAADGTYTSSSDFTVTITCATSGAAIHYTTDGSTPSVSTATYTAPISVAGNGTTLTIKAVGTKSGMTDSVLAQGIYTVNYTKVSTPQFNPAEGTYTTDQSVAISTTTSGTTIYFTTDGSDPTTSATKSTYSIAIAITGPSTTKTIKAYATKAAMSDSTVGSATYTVSYPTYTVSYNANGADTGTVPVDSTNYLQGQTVNVAGYGSLSKTGSYFIGWNTAVNGSGTNRAAGSIFTMGSANVTLYAQWLGDLVASVRAAGDYFGNSVAASSDGSTLVIGAPYGNNSKGAAYVFTKSGSSWSQAAELTNTIDGATSYDFGWSVAASSDGKTLAIGEPGWNNQSFPHPNQGAVYVFTWSGTLWSLARIIATDGAINDRFGTSIGASSDCNTLVIGAEGYSTSQGAAYVFTGSGSSWTQQTKLFASDGSEADHFGYSAAASGDGKTLVIGAYDKSIGLKLFQGEAYVFTGSGSSWTQQTTPLTASDAAAYDYFGTSVSASGDGSTLVIGAYGKQLGDNISQGAAYVFIKSEGSWSQQGSALTASDGASGDHFGYSVSESGDGNTLAIGAYDKKIGSNSFQGEAYLYAWSGSSWIQTPLTASDGATNDNFGCSIAASNDGSTFVIGASGKASGGNTSEGAAYVFTK